jgi:glycosyltransferase involved in cell wall biosynthesis
MTMNPVVSIVVVAMNDEPFIHAALDSALRQTYPDVRVHVQHGAAGTDRTLEIVRDYPVAWISELDTGFPDAANRGAKATDGEVILFQAGDDCLLPDCIEVLVRALNAQPEAGFAFGDIDYINASGKPFQRVRGRRYNLDDLYWSNHVTTQSVLMRRSAFMTAGMYRAGIINADWDLFIRMGARYPSVYVPQLLAEYRVHDQSHSLTHLDKMAADTTWVADTTLADPIIRSRLTRGPNRARAGSQLTASLLYVLAGSRTRALKAFATALRLWPPASVTIRGLMTAAAILLGPDIYARLRARGRGAG